jgi:hypothetical protein
MSAFFLTNKILPMFHGIIILI